MNIARTTLSSKILTQHKEHFSKLAVEAVLRLKGSGNLDAIHLIKKLGGNLIDSYLDEGWSSIMKHYSPYLGFLLIRLPIYHFKGFLLDKTIGVHQPKRIENARILIANTPMDTDKIKVSFNNTFNYMNHKSIVSLL